MLQQGLHLHALLCSTESFNACFYLTNFGAQQSPSPFCTFMYSCSLNSVNLLCFNALYSAT